MEDLGAYLQKLREDQRISFEKVFEDLRLREDQARKMEENNFFELGPYGIAKAMVYSYARYLGGNIDEVMAEFHVMMPETTKKQFKPGKLVKPKKFMISPNFFWMIGIIAFVIVLAGILWYSYNQGWLKTPELFRAHAPDSTAVIEKKKEVPKADPQRLQQKKAAEAVKQQTPMTGETRESTTQQDNTDYMREFQQGSQTDVDL